MGVVNLLTIGLSTPYLHPMTQEKEKRPSSTFDIGTVRDLWDKTTVNIQSDDERDLLDLAFRTAFQLHPDYWADFDVQMVEKGH